MERTKTKRAKSETDRTFVLDTELVCFLCLKTIKISNVDCVIKLEPGEEELSSYQPMRCTLFSICRYLGIDFPDVLNNSLEDEEESNLLEKVSNCSVTLCKGCAGITSELSDFCMELELVRMKVEQSLQSFVNELENSEMDVVRVQKFAQLQAGQLKRVHFNVAEMLRNALKKQGDKRLNSKLPKVMIPTASKIPPITPKAQKNVKHSRNPLGLGTSGIKKESSFDEEEESQNEDDDSGPENEDKDSEDDDEDSEEEGSKLEYDDFQNDDEDNVDDKQEKFFPPSNDATPKPAESQRSANCTFCQPTLQIVKKNILHHQVRHHLDKLMIHYKQPNISASDFIIYCENIFKSEITSCQKRTYSNGISILHCAYCSITSKSQKNAHHALKHHLFKEHVKIVGKKLIELQENYTVDELPEDIETNKSTVLLQNQSGTSEIDENSESEEEGSEIEDEDNTEPFSLSPEDNADLQDKSLPPTDEVPKMSSKCKKPLKDPLSNCTLCKPPKLIGRGRFRDHKILSHVESLLTDHKLPNISSDDFKFYCNHVFKVKPIASKKENDTKRISICYCPHCTIKYASHKALRVHIFIEHKDILVPQLIELQNKATAGDSPLQYFKCEKCEKTFAVKSSLQQHERHYCKFGPQIENPHHPRKNKTEESRNPNICTICEPPMEIAYGGMPVHRIRQHLDVLMAIYKSANVSSSDFKLYCERVLKMETISCKKEKNEKGKSISCCPYCCNRYTRRHTENLRRHFVTVHAGILGEKLVKLQETMTVAELKATKLPAVAGLQIKKCEECGMEYKERDDLRKHKLFICKFGPRLKARENQPPFQCRSCWKICGNLDELIRHKKEDCQNPEESPEVVGKASKKTIDRPQGSQLSRKREYPAECTLCNPPVQITQRRQAMECHRIRMHLDVLMAEYKSSNVSSCEFKIYCDHLLKTESISCRKKTRDGASICYCPYCSNTYSGAESLRIHLYRHHKANLGEKLMEMQENTEVDELNTRQLPKFGPKMKRTANSQVPRKKKKVSEVRESESSEEVEEEDEKTPKVSVKMEIEDEDDDSSYHPDDSEVDSEEMEDFDENLRDHQVIVKIDRDSVPVKNENIIDDDVDMIFPEDDPLFQF